MLRYEKPKFVLIGSPDSRGEQWTWLQHRLEQDQAEERRVKEQRKLQRAQQLNNGGVRPRSSSSLV